MSQHDDERASERMTAADNRFYRERPSTDQPGLLLRLHKAANYANAAYKQELILDAANEIERLRRALENALDALYEAWERSGNATDHAAYTLARMELDANP
jgi:hypothetical protein